jgi:hypothetical protein
MYKQQNDNMKFENVEFITVINQLEKFDSFVQPDVPLIVPTSYFISLKPNPLMILEKYPENL